MDRSRRGWATVAGHQFELTFGHWDPELAADPIAGAIDDFAAAGNERGLARAWLRSAWIPWTYMNGRDAEVRVTKSLEHAHRAGFRGDEVNALAFLANLVLWGPAPMPEARATLDEILRQAGSDRRLQAYVSRGRAALLAMEGRFDEAGAEHERSLETFRDLGLPILVAESAQLGYFILVWEGKIAAAAALLTRASADLAALNEHAYLPTNRAMLASCLGRLGRLDEAETEAVAARETTQPSDFITDASWRSALAIVYSRRGDREKADRLSREAVGILERSDMWRSEEVFTDRADVLAAAGQSAEADEAMVRAIGIYGAKGATAVVRRLEGERSV